jgi:broad specificity phosphatase PhoE
MTLRISSVSLKECNFKILNIFFDTCTMVSIATRTRRLCVFLLVLFTHCSVSLTTIGRVSVRGSSGRSILNPAHRQSCSGEASSSASSSSFLTILNAKSTDTATNDDEEQVPGARRRFLLSVPLIFLAPKVVQARGLVRFPCEKDSLLNSYHFLHAGTSLLEEEGIWSTNPLLLTNREDALSPAGQEQVEAACRAFIEDNFSFPTIVRYSLAAKCIDTGNIVGRELGIGSDRLQPEFVFLDPRAIGKWDMLSKKLVEPAVWAMDVDEAGNDGFGGLPPPNEDGTPTETLADQAIRLRQLLSALESQYSGDTILLIFPDGTGPALLSAMMAGIPCNRVHELEYAPGEIRFNVTDESTLELLKTREGDATYAALVQKGRKRLKTLRATNEFVNMKDQKLEADRLTIAQRKIEKADELVKEEELGNQQRLERQGQMASFLQQKSGGSSPLPAVALALAGVSAIGTTAAFRIGRSGGDTALSDSPIELSDVKDSITEPLPTELREPPLTNVTRYTPSSRVAQTVNGDTRKSIFDEGPRVAQTVNGNTRERIFDEGPLQPVNPRQAAKKAMQDYLDEDDGGDAWLQSIAEIAQDADDDEIDEPEEGGPYLE